MVEQKTREAKPQGNSGTEAHPSGSPLETGSQAVAGARVSPGTQAPPGVQVPSGFAAPPGALTDDQVTILATAIADSVKASAPESGHQPRTSWDALTEIVGKLFDLLGKSAVYLLVLALLGVGWYFLEEQQNKKDAFTKQQVELLEKQRNKAFELVQKSYREITDVAGAQIVNLDSSMKLLKIISDEVDQNQKQIFDKKLDAYKTEVLLKQTRVEVSDAQAQIQKKQSAIDRAEAKAAESRREKERAIEEARKTIEEEKKKLDSKEKALTQRAGTIADLQNALTKLADATKMDMNTLEEGSRSVYDELERVGGELREALMPVLAEEPSPEISAALEALSAASVELLAVSRPERYTALTLSEGPIRDFIIDPAEILKPLVDLDQPIFDGSRLDGLVGVSLQKVIKQIKQANGFGFDYWVISVDDSSSPTFLFGAVQDAVGLLAVVVLISEQGEYQDFRASEGDEESAEGARIVETEYVRGLVPAYVPSADDWLQMGVETMFVDEDRDLDTEFDLDWQVNPKDGTLSFAYLLGTAVKLVWGTSEAFEPLSKEQLNKAAQDNRLPHRVRQQLRDPTKSPRLNFDMIARAEDPDALLSRSGVDRISERGLREFFEKIIHTAIAKDVIAMGRFLDNENLDPAGVAGKLASLALRPEFRVSEASVGQREPVDSAEQARQMGMSLAPTESSSGQVPVSNAWVQKAVITVTSEIDFSYNSLTFKRTSTRPAWRLAALDIQW